MTIDHSESIGEVSSEGFESFSNFIIVSYEERSHFLIHSVFIAKVYFLWISTVGSFVDGIRVETSLCSQVGLAFRILREYETVS